MDAIIVGIITNIQGVGYQEQNDAHLPSIVKFKCNSCNKTAKRLAEFEFSCSTCIQSTLSLLFTAKLSLAVGSTTLDLMMWDPEVRALLGMDASLFYNTSKSFKNLEGLMRLVYCSHLAQVWVRPRGREGTELTVESLDLPLMDTTLFDVMGLQFVSSQNETGTGGEVHDRGVGKHGLDRDDTDSHAKRRRG